MKRISKSGYLGKFKSIQSAIFTSIAALVLCAVLIVITISVKYTNTAVFENSSVYTQTIIEQMNQNIDSYIQYMENIASLVSTSEDTKKFLFSEMEDLGSRKRILEQFTTILEGREDIRNIGILQKNGRELFNDGNDTINSALNLDTQEWYQNAINNVNQSTLTSSHVQHVIKDERPWVITLSRCIQGDNGEIGVFFIDLNYSAISELCDQNTIGEKGYVFILDQNGNIVYHPQQQQLYNELQTENIELVMQATKDAIITGTEKNDKLYAISQSNKTGWRTVGCMNMNELLKRSNQAQSIYGFTAAALMLVALLLSMMMAKNITLPIQRLRDSMEKVQKGDFSDPDVEVFSQNEIGSLTNSFNLMTHKIQELMEQNVREQEAKRKSELKALQSQINPHFLYNTLDSIIWMAEGKKYEQVVLMTASLARLLRQSISNEDELVSIRKEIEYAVSYLTIQKMRYKDKLEFKIEVDENIKDVFIIKLVLQPIIENAIYHGLKYKDSKGLLIVKGYQEGENVIIKIIDDGVGMEKEIVDNIFEKHKVNYQSNGVGVYNVQKRLELYYGSGYGMKYTSQKGVGTTATIIIPAKTGGKNETI